VTGPRPDTRGIARFDELNRYAAIIAEEAQRRGIGVTVLDPALGELALTFGGRRVVTLESLSELTTAVAFRRCDSKRYTRQVLSDAGLTVAPGRVATFDAGDRAFLTEWGDIVVKPDRGEQGWGISVGVTDEEHLTRALDFARAVHPVVLLERRCDGDDVRALVIGGEMVAASVRRPARVRGDGVTSMRRLIERASRERADATHGAARIPLDDSTLATVTAAGYTWDAVVPDGEVVTVRGTANLHTGGTIHDITERLAPAVREAAVAAAAAIGIPVLGVDLIVPDLDGEDYTIIEANEQPGLANHEPRPTAERFIDLLFPETA
jgi:GNAT-family acetyltransferase (TIGR03103 family)